MPKRFTALITAALLACLPSISEAGSIVVHNNSAHKIKVASIGGSGTVEPNSSKTIDFKNEENGADINIWWLKNARELCQIYTPWDRTIRVSGKYTIACLSRN
ncbi:hypothetical protein [Terasakiella sp. SH-1]|uniref:hypothetical protein n=1 Tax=Terasakiella sp. SH-1 TaxID=2560057 RepID=UPI0010747C09|nr:hypothetical protein [Terasakiella sp. SH-1]